MQYPMVTVCQCSEIVLLTASLITVWIDSESLLDQWAKKKVRKRPYGASDSGYLKDKEPRCTFQILSQVSQILLTKRELVFRSSVLKAKEFEYTFQNVGQVLQILHFQIKLLFKSLFPRRRNPDDHHACFRMLAKCPRSSISKCKLLIQKLGFEGLAVQEYISGFWPGVPDPGSQSLILKAARSSCTI